MKTIKTSRPRISKLFVPSLAIAAVVAATLMPGASRYGAARVEGASQESARNAPGRVAGWRSWKSPEKNAGGQRGVDSSATETTEFSGAANALTPCVEMPINLGQTVNGTLAANACQQTNGTFYDIYTFNATAGQQVSVTMTSSAFDAYLFLLYDDGIERMIVGQNDDGGGGNNSRIPSGSGVATLPFTGRYYILANSQAVGGVGDYALTLTVGGGSCPSTSINIGQTLNGALNIGECRLPDETLLDLYTFSGAAGQPITISLSSASFDAYLYLLGPDGRLVAIDDDGGSPPNSRIPAGSGQFSLPASGTFTILANTFVPSQGQPTPTGSYTLSLTGQPTPASSVQFSSAAFSGPEETPSVATITVTRTGDTTGEAFVSYTSTDGTASERRDYTAAPGRLRFAPGDTSKTFEVVITNDAFNDDGESFNLSLDSPVGATLGAQSTATVSINDNDAADGPSPVKNASFNTEFYVRQHYHDFLNRAPDAAGLAFWMSGIDSCATQGCREVKRVDTSAAFFLSIEFQETGYFVHRVNKAAYGDISGTPVPVRLRPFLAETRRIGEGVQVGIGNWAQQLEANKNAFVNELVTRPKFTLFYPPSMSASGFVERLNTRAGNVLSPSEHDALVNALTNGTMTRAEVLRAVAEDQTLKDAEFREAFVLMQYFGYLRRDPDAAPDGNFAGYFFWLQKLNDFNGDFRRAEMVKAFISSIEYTDRFGQ